MEIIIKGLFWAGVLFAIIGIVGLLVAFIMAAMEKQGGSNE